MKGYDQVIFMNTLRAIIVRQTKEVIQELGRDFCQCNCGELASLGSKFITGHHVRTPSLRIASSKRMKKLHEMRPELFEASDQFKLAGQTVLSELRNDPQYKEERRIQALGQWRNPDFRAIVVASSKKTIKRLHEDKNFQAGQIASIKARWKQPEYRNHMIEVLSNARRYARRPTSIERFSMESLNAHGFTFMPHEIVCELETDQTLSDFPVVCFEDGCFWHGCKIHCPGTYTLPGGKYTSEEARLHDENVTLTLECFDKIVIRAWECEIKKNHDVIGQRVAEALKTLNENLMEVAKYG